jgi:PAS domain S-box-containing protein
MLPETIILQSAGSLSVGLLALLMMILQGLFFLRRPQFTWYAWSAVISLSALLYSVGIFFEYNTPPGPLNRFSGLLEFTAIICLIHCLYGFTFSYFSIESRRYHKSVGLFHALILIILWSTDYIVAGSFTTRNFIGLESPYIEPDLGPLGPVFVLYTVMAAIYGTVIWIKQKRTDPKHRTIYMAGIGFWILLGIHDGLASTGIPAFLYVMEYGFLGFAMAVLWVVFNNNLEISAEKKYRVITEFANDCILIIQDGKIIFGNPAFRDLTGLSLSGSAAENLFDLMVPEDRKAARQYYNTILEGSHVPNPFMVSLKGTDCDQRIVEISSSLIQYRNRPAVLLIMRDMTERKREEAALRESEEKLARLKKMESLGLLAGGVAHDLNNVLSGIVSFPELILMDLPENSKFRKPVMTMQEAGKRAVAIVQDLLTVARGVSAIKEPLNLNNIINEYFNSPEFIKLKQFNPAVTVKSDLTAELFNVIGSHDHLRNVIMNLVSNAAEAIKGEGRITISTMNRYVDRPLPGYPDVNIGEYALLSISDTGPGITSDDLGRIFEPFYTKKVMGRRGTGLGLAVVWNVVQDHKGYIDVISDKNGTRFDLYFPETTDGLRENDLYTPLKDYKGSGETILVVDDVDSQRDISCNILTRLGYKTIPVSSGEEALEYIEKYPVDLMLIDMIMDPGINGRETYERVTRIHPDQKAIIVSGFSETEDVKAARKLGINKFIKKPFSLENIGMVVKETLEK